MPLCSHFCPSSILLPFLGTSDKPGLPCTHSQAGAGWSSELCLELDLPHLLPLPLGPSLSSVVHNTGPGPWGGGSSPVTALC